MALQQVREEFADIEKQLENLEMRLEEVQNKEMGFSTEQGTWQEEKEELLEREKQLNRKREQLRERISVLSPTSYPAGLRYFIPPEAQALVRRSIFHIVKDGDEEKTGGVGVFFRFRQAITADHNLTKDHHIGGSIKAKIPSTGEELELWIVHRDSELNFAILQSPLPHAHVPMFPGSLEELTDSELVLTTFFGPQLGFTKAEAISVSEQKRHLLYSCPVFAGNSGAAFLLHDGCLVGLHQDGVNAFRERLERTLKVADCPGDVDKLVKRTVARGRFQGCHLALLVRTFADI